MASHCDESRIAPAICLTASTKPASFSNQTEKALSLEYSLPELFDEQFPAAGA